MNFAYVDAFLDEPVFDISAMMKFHALNLPQSWRQEPMRRVDEFVWTLPDGSMAIGIEITTTQEGWHMEAQTAMFVTGLDSFYVSYLNTQFVYDVQSSGPLSCSIH